MEGLRGIEIPKTPTAQHCSIHKDVLLVTTPVTSKPFCPKCAADRLKKKKKEHDRRISEANVRDFLYKYSLVDSSIGFDKSFENYKADKSSQEHSVGKSAFIAATEYIKTPGHWKTDEDGNIYHGHLNKMQRIHGQPITTLMCGTPGQGKSHLAMAMIKKINKESKIPQRCLFIDINMLFDRIKSSFNNPTEYWTQAQALETLTNADTIVLDDLGSESSMRHEASESSDFKQQFLKKLFDGQHRVIITTNLNISELGQVYNAKLVSRILANSKGHVIDFGSIQDKRMVM